MNDNYVLKCRMIVHGGGQKKKINREERSKDAWSGLNPWEVGWYGEQSLSYSPIFSASTVLGFPASTDLQETRGSLLQRRLMVVGVKTTLLPLHGPSGGPH